MMGRRKRGLRFAATVLCSIMFIVGATGVLADSAYYEKSLVTPGSTSNPGSVLLSRYNLYNDLVTPSVIRAVDSGKTMDESVERLIADLQDGDMKAAKDGYFANVTDANNGVVKLVFDVVARPPTEAVDVLMVLDESGSMTMYSKTVNAPPSSEPENYQYTVPCLNPDHFYKVEYYLDADTATKYSYDLYPNRCPHVNIWEDSAFIQDVKSMIAADRGIEAGRITMDHWMDGLWDFGDHHYNGTSGNKIERTGTGAHDPLLDGNNTGDYYSPPFNNAAGCFDRQIIAKNALTAMRTATLQSNTESRFGLVTFAEFLGTSTGLSGAPLVGLTQRNGYDNTNYEVAMAEAYRILGTTPKPDGRKTVVIFVTDGMPNHGSEARLITHCNDIKALDDTSLYCVGIKVGGDALLKRMASDGCYKDCSTQKEFEDFLNGITRTISANAGVMIDVLGNAYGLVCDREHPISIQTGRNAAEIKYETLAAAQAAGVRYNETDSKLTWQVVGATSEGVRLSFYVKLDESFYLSNLPGSEGSYPTNNAATIDYTKVDPRHPGEPGTDAQLTLPNPATIKIEQSRLTAVKSSDRPDEIVLPDEQITYTIDVRNAGVFDYSNVKVADPIPAGTEYVPGSGGTLESNRVVFDIPSVRAGGTERVSFKVKVLPGKRDVVNYAKFGTGDVSASIDRGAPVCYANRVVNPRPGSASAGADIPDTGDNAMPWLWAGMMLLGAAGLLALYRRRKKA